MIFIPKIIYQDYRNCIFSFRITWQGLLLLKYIVCSFFHFHDNWRFVSKMFHYILRGLTNKLKKEPWQLTNLYIRQRTFILEFERSIMKRAASFLRGTNVNSFCCVQRLCIETKELKSINSSKISAMIRLTIIYKFEYTF